jgi:ABC-type spermidine/putrescine transport system permease subunit II
MDNNCEHACLTSRQNQGAGNALDFSQNETLKAYKMQSGFQSKLWGNALETTRIEAVLASILVGILSLLRSQISSVGF